MGTRYSVEKEELYGYHRWLVSVVDTPEKDFSRYYTCLTDHMDGKAYRYVVARDQDRYVDGLHLRDVYGIRRDGPCSILECLVALFAKYSDTVLTDPGDVSVAPELFYDAMEHLGLLFFDDSRYDFRQVEDILEGFLEWKIRLFGVKNCKKSEGIYLLAGKHAMLKW